MADIALILSADHYSITDDKTGQVQELYQVWYCNDYREDSETEIGGKPIKMLTTPEVFKQLRAAPLPSLYALDLRSRPGKGNAAALTVVGMKYITTPKIFELAAAPKAA
jgi:hypothetical protein